LGLTPFLLVVLTKFCVTFRLSNTQNMLKYIYISFSFLLVNITYSQSPVASFSTTPAPVLGLITICQGSTINFVNTSSQTLAGATYSWNFGLGATPATAVGAGPHLVTYNTVTAPTTTATLTVNNNNALPTSNFARNIDVNVSPISNITLLSNGAGFGTSVISGLTFFKKCGAIDSSVFLFNSSYSNATVQTFTWGDGSSSTQVNMAGNQISHNYPMGQFTLTHTVTINGCSTSKNYIVFNGNSPVITVSGSGQTTCLPSPYSIDILSNGSPIDYTVSFSDGSPSTVFTTDNDTTISHIFNTSSCGIDYVFSPSFPPIQNSFSATIVAQNACSNGLPTVITVGPITISTGASAAFSYSPASPVCQEDPVTFDNQSTGGENISGTGCDSTYSFYWQITQMAGYTISAGTLGSNNGFVGNNYDFNQWTSGSDNLEVTFNVPGTYNMWIYAANFCGVDSTMQIVTIIPFANVTLDDYSQTICSGDTSALFTMTSTIPNYIINWEITDSTNVTGITNLTGSGLSPLGFNPLVLYNNTDQVGTVEITSNVSCTNSPAVIHTITVNPQGNINVDPIQQFICSGDTTDFSISSNLNNATFSWTTTAPGTIVGESAGAGTSIEQVLTNTGTTIDTVFYTIVVGNVSCPGPDVVVSVAVQPQITISVNPDFTVCAGETINPNNYISTPAGATIIWSNSNTNIGIGASGNGDLPTWNAGANSTGSTISGTITVSASLNGCPGVQDVFIVNVLSAPDFTYTTSPASGLDCITNTGVILGVSNPANSTVSWTGPSIVSGANTLSPVVNAPGQYIVTLTDNVNGCITTDTVQIDPPTLINITSVAQNNVSCFNGSNGSIVINTDNGNGSNLQYDWVPQLTNSATVNGLSIGTYTVVVTNEDGCQDDTTVTITQPGELVIMQQDSIGSECGEANGSLSVYATGGQGSYQYEWNNGQNSNVIINIDEGTYVVTVTDGAGCTQTATFGLGCTPLIPIEVNQFISPNGDGKNDVWIIDSLQYYPLNKVMVYNRWGSLVFEAEPYQNDWNGHFKGTAPNSLPASTYFYVIDTMKKSQDPYTGYIEIQP
jgi:gliding motility-associated-like protein